MRLNRYLLRYARISRLFLIGGPAMAQEKW